MTRNETIIEAAQLAAVLARRHSGKTTDGYAAGQTYIAEQVALDVTNLFQIARGIKRRGERACNYALNDRQVERDEKMNERAYAKAESIAARYGATVRKMMDVRGAALKLAWNEGTEQPGNSFFERNVWGVG